MAFTVEDGSGIAGANAFISIVYADSYHTDHGDPSAWSDATDAVKEAAIIEATSYLDGKFQLRWIGTRASQSQGLHWPRYDAYDPDEFLRPSDTVPVEVTSACAIMALKAVNGDTLQPDVSAGAYGIKKERVKAAVIEEAKEYVSSKPTTKRYVEVLRVLRPVLKNRNVMRRA